MVLNFRIIVVLEFALALLLTEYVASYSEQENLAFINKIISFMNNNEECELPTFQEVDEMKKSFVELEELYGEQFDDKLTSDQKLARQTVLYQWDEFYARMNEAVIMRSPAKLSFLCLIEAYQLKKYGKSVCTAIKTDRKADTKRIFIKNPHVRYLQLMLDREENPELEPAPEPIDWVVHTPIVEEAPQVEEVVAEPTAEEETEKPVEEDNGSSDSEENHDPLSDVPVPAAADTNQDETLSEPEENSQDTNEGTDDQPEPEPEPEPEAEPETQIEEPAEIKPADEEVFYDEDGAELVDADFDDEDLDRLNKVPPKKWAEKEFNQFRWPDEGWLNDDEEKVYDPTVRDLWFKFVKAPDSVTDFSDLVVEEQPVEVEPTPVQVEPTPVQAEPAPVVEPEPAVTLAHPGTETKQTPEDDDDDGKHLGWNPPSKISAFALMRKRREYERLAEIGARVEKYSQRYGWEQFPAPSFPDYASKKEEEQAKPEPETKKDAKKEWKSLADNKYCKLTYNKSALTNNKATRAVKRLIKRDHNSKNSMLGTYGGY